MAKVLLIELWLRRDKSIRDWVTVKGSLENDLNGLRHIDHLRMRCHHHLVTMFISAPCEINSSRNLSCNLPLHSIKVATLYTSIIIMGVFQCMVILTICGISTLVLSMMHLTIASLSIRNV